MFFQIYSFFKHTPPTPKINSRHVIKTGHCLRFILALFLRITFYMELLNRRLDLVLHLYLPNKNHKIQKLLFIRI
jgi:hypothetical protein